MKLRRSARRERATEFQLPVIWSVCVRCCVYSEKRITWIFFTDRGKSMMLITFGDAEVSPKWDFEEVIVREIQHSTSIVAIMSSLSHFLEWKQPLEETHFCWIFKCAAALNLRFLRLPRVQLCMHALHVSPATSIVVFVIWFFVRCTVWIEFFSSQ